MKCGKCGATLKDIKAVGAHYRKHHPGAMKRKRSSPKKYSYGALSSLAKTMAKIRTQGYTEAEVLRAYWNE